MALSNWLTRDEWNACYFAGIKEIIDGKPCNGLGDQLCLGIGYLHRAGHKFTGITSDEKGNYDKVTQCCTGNETVLAELIGGYGGFDKLARAKEVLEWKDGPNIDWDWLRDAIAEVGLTSPPPPADSTPRDQET